MEKLKKIYLNKYFLIHIIVLFSYIFLAFVINAVPNKTIIVGGDYYQLLDPIVHFQRYAFAWINQIGQGAFNTLSVTLPFYSFLALFQFFGVNNGVIASSFIFIILYFSFLSFYLSIKYLVKDLPQYIRIGSSLTYSINALTYNFFVYPWGYTHQFLIYIFTPPLLFLFLEIFILKEINIKKYILFAIIFSISTISYNNIAFFVLLGLLQGLSFILFVLFKKIDFNFITIKKIIIFLIVYLISFGPYLYSFYISNISIAQKITTTQAFGGDSMNIIRISSNSIENIFAFYINGFHAYFFILSSLYLIILTFLVIKSNKNIIGGIFLILYLLIVALATRLHDPFYSINYILYHSFYFSFFRSPDKIFILLPLIYTTLLAIYLNKIDISKRAITLILILLILIPYRFFTGSIIQAIQAQDSNGYEFDVSIPQDYYHIQSIINSEPDSGSIISLPFSVVNSLNWSNYPAWGAIGHDVLHLLYSRNYISANVYDHPTMETQLSFKDFNDDNDSSAELMKLIQNFSGKFIIFHKDIDSSWLKNTKNIQLALKDLQRTNEIVLLESNSYFNLYRVNTNYQIPLISSLPNNIEYVKKSPSEYNIDLNLKDISTIQFNQSFNSEWKLYLLPINNSSICNKLTTYSYSNTQECSDQNIYDYFNSTLIFSNPIFDKTHVMINNYANSWKIDPEFIKENLSNKYYILNNDGSINIRLKLYFRPQSLLNLHFIITFFVIFFGCIYLFLRKKEEYA